MRRWADIGQWASGYGPTPTVSPFADQGAFGFQAGDANLYRYVGNDPTNAVDPSGLEKADTTRVDFDKQYGVPTGVFHWPFKAPEAPKDLNLYTKVDMQWEIKKGDDKPQKGNYRFWFQGFVPSSTLDFNLWPKHGSHRGPDNKITTWPVFNGETRKDRDEQLDAYLRESLDLTKTSGTLTVRLEYRAYKKPAAEKFEPKFEEMGGACEVPTMQANKTGKTGMVSRAPNRMRLFLRGKYPWLSEEPKIWDNDPESKYVIEMTYTWNWSSKEFGKYTIKYPGKDPLTGTTPYPKK